MPGESTVILLNNVISDILTVTSQDVTIVLSSDIISTVLTSSPATLNTGIVNFGDGVPAELSENGSAGVATTASRSDHRHPSINLGLNGGNY